MWAAWLIIVGLGIEILLAVIFQNGLSWYERWCPVIATSLIALGVYFEIYFEGQASRARDELKIRSEQKLADAHTRAAKLEQEAAESRKSAATLAEMASINNARAEEANRKAVEAQLTLEKIRAPRLIPFEQQDCIVRKLLTFVNVNYVAYIYSQDEPFRLFTQIDDILVSAGWTRVMPGGIQINLPGGRIIGVSQFFSGMRIQTDPNTPEQMIQAANMLASQLEANNISVVRDFDQFENMTRIDQIVIQIGEKKL